jgi:hypothetical protein
MKPISYPEDIQCVFEEMPGKRLCGCIFIGNLEAGQSLKTLHSISALIFREFHQDCYIGS